jgi:hypothetical protein
LRAFGSASLDFGRDERDRRQFHQPCERSTTPLNQNGDIAARMEHTPAYVVDWQLAESERGVETFKNFLTAAGVKFEVSADLRKMLDVTKELKPSPRIDPRGIFEEHLMVAGNKALESSGDARRLVRELGGEVRRWRLLTPDELTRAAASGMKFEKAGAHLRRTLWTLATIPVAIGTYVLTTRLLRERGIDENLAWLIAMAAWFGVRQVLNRTLLKAR